MWHRCWGTLKAPLGECRAGVGWRGPWGLLSPTGAWGCCTLLTAPPHCMLGSAQLCHCPLGFHSQDGEWCSSRLAAEAVTPEPCAQQEALHCVILEPCCPVPGLVVSERESECWGPRGPQVVVPLGHALIMPHRERWGHPGSQQRRDSQLRAQTGNPDGPDREN